MLSAIDVAIFVSFLLYSVWSGLRSRAISSQNLEEYFLAGRSLPGWKAGLSMAATQFAADTPLLVTGMIATAGVFSLWRLWIYAIAFLLMGFLLGGAWRRSGVLTDAELAELRYGGQLATWLRALKAIYFGVIFNCTVMAMVLFAATRIAEPFLRWDEWLPPSVFSQIVELVKWVDVPLTSVSDPATWAQRSASNLISLASVLAVTTLYSTTGGLRAVVDTDVVQLGVALLGTLLYAAAIVTKVGGLSALPEHLVTLYGQARTEELLAFTPDGARDVSVTLISVIAIQWFAQMNADGTGYLAQRTMACRSDRDARFAAVVFVITQVVLRSLLWLPIGVGLLVLLPAGTWTDSASYVAQREATYIEGVSLFLPSGAKGLLLTGMFAALASTLDTHLNWGASYFTNDLYKRLYCELWKQQQPSARSLVWVARASNLLILALSLILLTKLRSIQAAWTASLLLGAGMGVPLLLRWLWWRMTAASELVAILSSLISAPLLMLYVPMESTRLLLMTITTALAAITVTLLFPPTISTGLIDFYRKVRPPGFWGPVSAVLGEDRKRAFARLVRGGSQTFWAVVAVFSALVALGTLILQSPAPSWFPWSTPWVILLLGLSGFAAWFVRKAATEEEL